MGFASTGRETIRVPPAMAMPDAQETDTRKRRRDLSRLVMSVIKVNTKEDRPQGKCGLAKLAERRTRRRGYWILEDLHGRSRTLLACVQGVEACPVRHVPLFDRCALYGVGSPLRGDLSACGCHFSLSEERHDEDGGEKGIRVMEMEGMTLKRVLKVLVLPPSHLSVPTLPCPHRLESPSPHPPSLAHPTTALSPYPPQVCQKSISQLVPAPQNPASSSSPDLSPFLHPIRERRREEAGAPLPAVARSSDEGGNPSKERSSGVATPLDLFGRRLVLTGRDKEDAFHLVQLLVRDVAFAHSRRFLSAQNRLLLPHLPFLPLSPVSTLPLFPDLSPTLTLPVSCCGHS